MSRGTFIVIDGPEGAGKTTVIGRLAMEFPELVIAREPGGTIAGEALRSVLKSRELAPRFTPVEKMMLFWASRASFLAEVVRPQLESGKTVVVDRFDASTYAYQVMAESSSKLEELFWSIRENLISEVDLAPDTYIFLSCPPEVGLKRTRDRNGEVRDYYDEKDIHFHRQVFRGYQEFFRKVEGASVRIDASADDSVVYDRVRAEVNKLVLAPTLL